MGVSDIEFRKTVILPIRPVWELENTSVGLELVKTKHSNKTTDLVSEYYRLRDSKYKDCILIYFYWRIKWPTNECNRSAVAVHEFKVELSKITSDYLSEYTVEMFAILMALEWGEQFRCADMVKCYDSLSALASIERGAARTHQDYMEFCI